MEYFQYLLEWAGIQSVVRGFKFWLYHGFGKIICHLCFSVPCWWQAELTRTKLIGAWDTHSQWQCMCSVFCCVFQPTWAKSSNWTDPTLSLHTKKREVPGIRMTLLKACNCWGQRHNQILKKNPWLLRETIFKLSNHGWLSADLNWRDRQLARPALINTALLLPPPCSQGCDTFTDSLSLSTSNNNTNNQCLVPPDTPGPVMNHTRPGSGDGFSMQQTTEGF